MIEVDEGQIPLWEPSPAPAPDSLPQYPGLDAWRRRQMYVLGKFTRSNRYAGHSFGFTGEECRRYRALALKQAEKIVTAIAPELGLDEKAQEALTETITIMKDKSASKELKLKAARQVLDFTMAKPVARTEVTVNKAEEWLASLETP